MVGDRLLFFQGFNLLNISLGNMNPRNVEDRLERAETRYGALALNVAAQVLFVCTISVE